MKDAERKAQLRRMQRRATGLLVVVAAVFAVLAAGGHEGWHAYALAAAEGSLVGGLADWFAVTAIFRHPLGIPVPHTAVIRERKDQFGETLGDFVQQNFLTADIVTERIRAARMAPRLGAWLAGPEHADRVARSVLDAAATAIDVVGDEEVHRLVHAELSRALRAIPVAPLAGRALRTAVEDGRHRALVDALLRGAVSFLDEQRDALRTRFGDASPWWLPGAVEDRIFDRIVDGVQLLLAAVAADPDHELRATLDARLAALADTLEHDPATAARVEQIVADLLAHPDVRGWTGRLWGDVKRALEREVDGTDRAVRNRIAGAVASLGTRLAEDTELQDLVTGAVESGVRFVTNRQRGEIAALISATIARWDPAETSDKLELLLGRDLQFIRINGTIVGGLAGLAIHALAATLG